MQARFRKGLKQIIVPIVMVLLAFLFSAVVMFFTGGNPIAAYAAMFKGAFGTGASWINTLNRAVPISICAFGVALSKKCGLFNIGLEGQFLMGALGGTIAGIFVKGLPIYIHLPLCLMSGMLFGMIWSVIPAVLFIERKQSLVVSLLFMNIIAEDVLQYFIFGPLMGAGSAMPSTDKIQESARFPLLLSSPARLSSAVLIVLLVAGLMYVYMNKTYSGFELRATGGNRISAKFAGIHVRKYLYFAILVPGLLGGLSGAVEIQSRYFRLIDGFAPGYGWDALPIALLAGGNPLIIIIGSLLFGGMYIGSSAMQMDAGISSQIIQVIQGFLIIAVALDSFIRYMVNNKLLKRNISKSGEGAKA